MAGLKKAIQAVGDQAGRHRGQDDQAVGGAGHETALAPRDAGALLPTPALRSWIEAIEPRTPRRGKHQRRHLGDNVVARAGRLIIREGGLRRI
jgi:hypothetical protein